MPGTLFSDFWVAARRWADVASHLLFPKVCFACDRADAGGDGVLCRACRAAMGQVRRAPYCRRCGKTVGPFASTAPCSRCSDGAPTAEVLRVGEYLEPLSQLITAFKYSGREELGGTLGDWAARAARGLSAEAFDAVVPIPLHRNRRRARGFNQAERIAAVVAARFGRPMRSELLRVRDTPPQVGASAAERERNVADAFSTVRDARVTGLRVLLVDDVMTTGATAFEAARTLKRAGAESVHLLVVAVAPLPAFRPVEEGADESDAPTEG
jgi:ComF family protein